MQYIVSYLITLDEWLNNLLLSWAFTSSKILKGSVHAVSTPHSQSS